MTTKANSMMRGVTLATDREKILLVGGPGTQKSTSIVRLAELYPDVTVAVMDADDGIPRIVAGLGGWEKFPNIAYLPVKDWDDVEDAYETVTTHLTYGDWLCVDMAHIIRGMITDWYIRTVMKVSPKEMKLNLKKGGQAVRFGGLATDDWNIITLHWNDVFAHAFRRLTCNVLFTVAAEPIMVDKNGEPTGWDRSLPAQWIKLGMKAAGEKNLPFNCHTILFLSSREVGGKVTWHVKTVGKDRGRVPVDVDFTNLWLDYGAAVGLSNMDKSPGKVV